MVYATIAFASDRAAHTCVYTVPLGLKLALDGQSDVDFSSIFVVRRVMQLLVKYSDFADLQHFPLELGAAEIVDI